VLELGDPRRLGRIGAKTLGYTILASGISVAIGIGLVNTVRPGAGVDPGSLQALGGAFAEQSNRAIENAQKAGSWADTLLSLIPTNPVKTAVDALTGEMLALMVFALFFGIALAIVRDRSNDALVEVFRGIQQVSMKIVDWAMAIAPFGVAALMFTLTARSGFALIPRLGSYVLVVVGGLALQLFVVYGSLLKGLARVSPVEFFFRIREVMLTAFSTASSSATLPTSLQTAQTKLGISPRVGNFVLTVGATANQNGTALFEGVTVLFLAQVFGVDLSFGQQITVVLMSILAGVGTAGVPGGSLPLIVIVLQSVGIPAEGIGIILGVDRFLDMCRTLVNVVGDLVCATVIARSENELEWPKASSAAIVADA
jgi:DAACS family dicarboxylate/amino acid:cation (Na+ or H+) symporter